MSAIRIGTIVHVLEEDGTCAAALVRNHEPERDEIAVVAFPFNLEREDGLRGFLRHGEGVPHAVTPEPGAPSFHLVDECPWGR